MAPNTAMATTAITAHFVMRCRSDAAVAFVMLHLLCETIEHYVLLAGATLLLIAEEHNGRALGGLR